MKVIVAVDRYWGIGAQNDLLFKLPMDMMRFRALTSGHTVLMGYNTLLSFPGGKPLKNRRNIVLAPEGVERDDCVIVHSLDELKEVLKGEDADQAFVIGGAMFYHTMLPYCKEALITKVDAVKKADVRFDNLDEMPNWQLVESADPIFDNGQRIQFCTYINKDVKPF